MQTITIDGITYNAHPMGGGMFFMAKVGRSGRETSQHRPGRMVNGRWQLGAWSR
jgi:hypothetical protein